jgi:DNA-binding MarR family transcriptional regulator
MLARVRDPRDRRRTLVWLTDRARKWLDEEQEPLDRKRTTAVFEAMDPTIRDRFIDAFEQFITVAERIRERDQSSDRAETTTQQTKKKKGK